MTDGWTLAPSGWRYRVSCAHARPAILLRRNPPEGDGLPYDLAVDATNDHDVPPCDRELVRSLWEAKDA